MDAALDTPHRVCAAALRADCRPLLVYDRRPVLSSRSRKEIATRPYSLRVWLTGGLSGLACFRRRTLWKGKPLSLAQRFTCVGDSYTSPRPMVFTSWRRIRRQPWLKDA